MTGRPTIFTDELAITICERIADGKSLRSICLDDDMPDRVTVHRWLLDPAHEAFCNQYTRARAMQADTHVDEMQDIADDGSNDYVTKTNADGSTYDQVNSEHIQRSRLRIDTRKWVAERMQPKKYGTRVALTDPDGGPLTVQIVKFSETADADSQTSGE
ncbi:terminase small subunit protein [Mesorhizobium sp. M8A.F.Ca.ET.165.01.1.1]|nr:terminase small subunit protein [Mesorhizobium sp. M8A.F.Ca.ET.165.01.1.1]TGT42834.1 terminase small subunit protein [Mesorhizobium sp. M8A.F.Ca.ET.165.01.1.1]